MLLLALSLAASACSTTGVLHRRLLTLDSHLDTPMYFGVDGWDFAERHRREDDGSQVDIPRMIEGGLDGGFFATFIPQGPLTDEGRAAARAAAHARLDEIHAMVARHRDLAEIEKTFWRAAFTAAEQVHRAAREAAIRR